MRFERHILGELQTNCWIVSDDEDGPILVIDPAGEGERLLASIAQREIAAVVLTHGHFDHLGAAGQVLEHSGADLLVHEADATRITSSAAEGTGAAIFGYSDSTRPADRLLADGDIVEAGNLSLEVLHTPGHTQGSICLLGEGHLFSGDTVFAGSVGRTDFPGGDSRTLKRSIETKLLNLSDETLIHPGHGPDSSIGRERLINPFFPRA